MSKRIITELIDDIDGSPATVSRELLIDGIAYSVDLNERHSSKLDEALAPYVAAATKVGRGGARPRPATSPTRSTARPTAHRERMAAIRRWANEHGREVSARGRVSSAI